MIYSTKSRHLTFWRSNINVKEIMVSTGPAKQHVVQNLRMFSNMTYLSTYPSIMFLHEAIPSCEHEEKDTRQPLDSKAKSWTSFDIAHYKAYYLFIFINRERYRVGSINAIRPLLLLPKIFSRIWSPILTVLR